MSGRLWHASAVSPRLVRVTGLVVLVMGIAACAPPDTSERGFGSKQVLHVRDPALSLRSTFALDESGIYLARNVPGLTLAKGVPTPYDRTLVTFATGIEQPIGSGVLNVQLLPSADGLGRSLVMLQLPVDQPLAPMTTVMASALQDIDLTFLDEVSGTSVLLRHLDYNYVDLGVTRSDPILVRQTGIDDKDVLLMGAPENLVAMPTGLNQILGRDRLGFVGTSRPSNGVSGQAFARIPFDGSAAMQIIPGAIVEPPVVSGPDASLVGATVVPDGWDGQ